MYWSKCTSNVKEEKIHFKRRVIAEMLYAHPYMKAREARLHFKARYW